jgi:hypothetical protein
MKGRSIVWSIIAVVLVLCVPLTNAVQIQTVENELSNSIITYDALKNMDTDELIVFINSLSQDYPGLSETFQRALDKMEDSPISSIHPNHQSSTQGDDSQGPQSKSDNQTFFEKIYWKIYNYRVFRLLISALLFIKFQSKLTLWRTMTWGIRLLRWIKLGILLGYIEWSQQPQSPTISFEQDDANNTLTVVSVSPANILWSDIVEIGEGSCDPLPSGNVTTGDTLTDCAGIIVLQYIPTYEIIGVFEFE